MTAESKYLSVTDLNYYITQKFKNDPYLHKVFLEGELSNFRFRRNSHQYFSLKDEKSKINAVMFRSDFEKMKFKPEEGMKVYVTGYVGVYGVQGSYQFYVQKMEPAGLGELYERLRQLQEKLSKEGLFNSEHKRRLPRFPDKIAVVTSASGAVIHDIMVTANRRFPHAEIDLYPAIVQGEKASASLVAAMDQIKARIDNYDVMIIGRGGGSLEDLWPFNEEEVVRAVYNMPIPVISSVGHETDTTLCDLVADVRAATPTAAAEYATPNLADELAGIHQLQSRLLASMQMIIRQRKERLQRVKNSVIIREPMRLYDQQAQSLDLLKTRLEQVMQQTLHNNKQLVKLTNQRLISKSPTRQIEQMSQKTEYLTRNLNLAIENFLKDKRHNFKQLITTLDDISPLKVLARGFVYTSQEDGKTITTIHDLDEGQKINLHFKDGLASAEILDIKEKTNANEEK
ncbi:exodeoxyribonuclease VII large subunit [Lactobacillus psittaci]|uniref:Exodeoxyribonuclease 7 large subunit n=1 Tax=Lactobacillus psittaci DSM 15354 TaxID=1122152 RepID=A0A0R1S624_9LACO|nr:exodeoxyribonuclease VII large subunit [Lactobacillus psittaci]KRL63966.1 exodeoxyribonuclease VII, large subunit [Lactobacillus psittaci DSM 15354]